MRILSQLVCGTLFAVGVLTVNSAHADPVGVVVVDSTTKTTAAEGLWTCDLFAQFDDPDDYLCFVYNTHISTNDPNGFFQVPPQMGGSDEPPLELFINLFPELKHDSYVTIGQEFVPVGDNDITVLDPDWDSDLFNESGQTAGGWFCTNPFDPAAQLDEQGQGMIARFAVAQGYSVSGDLTLLSADGDTQFVFTFECTQAACPSDLNQDGAVNAADLALVIGSWGICEGCVADINGDGVVNAADLALVIGSWGPCD